MREGKVQGRDGLSPKLECDPHELDSQSIRIFTLSLSLLCRAYLTIEGMIIRLVLRSRCINGSQLVACCSLTACGNKRPIVPISTLAATADVSIAPGSVNLVSKYQLGRVTVLGTAVPWILPMGRHPRPDRGSQGADPTGAANIRATAPFYWLKAIQFEGSGIDGMGVTDINRV